MVAVRTSLATFAKDGPSASTHRGLWLDRFLPGMDSGSAGDGDSLKSLHLKSVVGGQAIPAGYEDFSARRRALLEGTPLTRLFALKTTGRLIVGIGRATPWENGIELHHTWGVPVIPGSALKGLAASFAHQHLADPAWRRPSADQETAGGASHETLFGRLEEQGCVLFHDALWLPVSGGQALGLHLDTITVHHKDYYQANASSVGGPPADWDSPIPIPFLSVSGRFLFAMTGPRPWIDAAMNILDKALWQLGVGAKTSSGYGRMTIEEQLSEADKHLRDLQARIARISLPTSSGMLHAFNTLTLELGQGSDSADLLPSLCQRVDACVDKKQKSLLRAQLRKLAINNDLLLSRLPVGWQQGQQNGDLPEATEESVLKLQIELDAHLAKDLKKGKKAKERKAYKKWIDKGEELKIALQREKRRLAQSK